MRAPKPYRFTQRLFIILFMAALAACSSASQAPRLDPAIPGTGATSTPGPQASKPAATPTSRPLNPTPTATAAGESKTGGSPKGCPVTIAPSISEAATLTLGPSPGLPPTEAEGEKLVIVGTVYADDCTPLAGAALNVWQTDANGEYGPGHGTDEMQCCTFQGQVRTDEDGRYRLITVKPGHYRGEQTPPPAHIHVEVSHVDVQPFMTEIVFAGDPYLGDAGQGGLILTTLETVAGPEEADTYLLGVADIVLPGLEPNPSPAPASGSTDGGGIRTFQIVPQESEAAYHIREKFNLIPVVTSATAVTGLQDGRIEIDFGNPWLLRSLAITVDLRGLKSDDPDRDEKLAGRWLVTDQFPFANFTAANVEGGPEPYAEGELVSFTLTGEMTIREVTRPASFDVTARLAGGTLNGTATGTIKMTDFEIDPPNLLDFVRVEDEVGITVNLTAREAE